MQMGSDCIYNSRVLCLKSIFMICVITLSAFPEDKISQS